MQTVNGLWFEAKTIQMHDYTDACKHIKTRQFYTVLMQSILTQQAISMKNGEHHLSAGSIQMVISITENKRPGKWH